jgi:tetratricopeptide (TPR) repeat protein
MPRNSLLATAILALLIAPCASAQTLKDGYVPSYDSIIHAPLEQLQRLGSPAVTDQLGSVPDAVIRSALVKARIGELTRDRAPIDKAIRDVGALVAREPDNGWAWFAIGYAKAALARAGLPASNDRFQPIGSSNAYAAAAALARAISIDPTDTLSKVLLADLLAADDRLADDQLADKRTVLKWARLAAAGDGCGAPQLARSRIERLYGDPDSAVAAASRFAECGDPDVAAFELSKSLFAAGDSTRAIEAYYRGAVARSPGAHALYRSDLALIATPEELAAIDAAAGPEERAEQIRRFWARRDVAAGRSQGERLTEHNRRLRYALEHFRYIGSHRAHEPIFVVRDTSSAFDDRGIVYVRHGEPTMTASDASLDIPNVSWLYREPGGNLIFHFRTGPDASVVGGANYHLVESIVDILGFRNALQVRAGQADSVAVLPLARQLFATRSGLDPRYDLLASNRVPLAAVQLERERGRDMLARGLSTDTYPLRFERSLNPVFQGYGVASPEGGTLLVPFALPVSRLSPLSAAVSGGRVAYRVAFRVVALSSRGIALKLDTVRTFVVPQGTTGGFIDGTLEMRAAPGEYSLSAIASQGSASGTAIELPDAFVPDPAASAPMVSSLMLGLDDGVAWNARGGTIELNPLNAYTPTRSAQICYQLGGFDPSGDLTIRLELVGPSGKPTALQFRERPGPFRLARRTLDLKGLKSGHYRLTLSVRQGSGSPLVRGADLYIADQAD